MTFREELISELIGILDSKSDKEIEYVLNLVKEFYSLVDENRSQNIPLSYVDNDTESNSI